MKNISNDFHTIISFIFGESIKTILVIPTQPTEVRCRQFYHPLTISN